MSGGETEEDKVIAFEAANEDGEISKKVWGGVTVGRGMVHLLLSPLGYHNHLPDSRFSLIQPLTRRGGEGKGRGMESTSCVAASKYTE